MQFSSSCRFVVDFVVQLAVQQIHNESNKWSLVLVAYYAYVQLGT